MSLWSLFNGPMKVTPSQVVYIIVDRAGEFEVDKDYAELGLSEGWLVVSRFHIDMWSVQHYRLRLI